MNDATGLSNYNYNAFGQLTAHVNNIYGSVAAYMPPPGITTRSDDWQAWAILPA